MLSERQIERYSRQLVLPYWGLAEQQALANCVIAVDEELLSAAVYLAAAGVGELTLLRFASEPRPSDPEREQLRAHLFGLNPDSRVSQENLVETGSVQTGLVSKGVAPNRPVIGSDGQTDKFFTHAIVKLLDGDSSCAREFAQSLEVQGAQVVRWVVTENCVLFGGRRIELTELKLLSAPLTAGTIAASAIMQSIAGFTGGAFPDRLPGNFGCSLG